MANLAAKFTSGLVLGSGAVYAFTAHFTEQAQAVGYKLRRASTELSNSVPGPAQSLPQWDEPKPEILTAYQRLAERLGDSAIPLAKSKWNGSVHAAANKLSGIDIDADNLASIFYTSTKK
ncbi:hypothetical protein GGF46_000699 [Coemansia sp. RSA 552]|nr:hypothetical protein GGF46_000699 [Coemansia sp. RSA 552]